MEPATSLAAAADRISPLAQKATYGSCATPFAPTTAVGSVVAAEGGTTTNCPSPDPTTYHRSKKLTNKIILDTYVRAEVGNTSSRRGQLPSFRGSARGRLSSARGDSLHAHRRLARPGDNRFRIRHRLATVGGSNSLRAPPRPLRLAHRICDPDDRHASTQRLDGPYSSLPTQQQQYSVRKETPLSHEPCET
jgi:hypothetical protein